MAMLERLLDFIAARSSSTAVASLRPVLQRTNISLKIPSMGVVTDVNVCICQPALRKQYELGTYPRQVLQG